MYDLCFLNTKILQISLTIRKLVPDQNFFKFEFMNVCDDFQFSVTRMSSTFYSVSKLKYRNLNSYFHLLILHSDIISLNPGPTRQHTLQCLNEWNIFKLRGLHVIHLNSESVLEPEIQIDDYKIVWFDRNRCRGGVAS